jgi:predicted ArsR family transcriptional regulator
MAGAELCLRNCPFDALAREHTALVCGVNLDFVGGVVDGLECAGVAARLDPAEDRCCVVVAERFHG